MLTMRSPQGLQAASFDDASSGLNVPGKHLVPGAIKDVEELGQER
jgi:hypothetical protein